MPRRADIQSVLVLGSGPIVIGQACEFDYAGTQALKALRAEGCRTILINSNPATIMTDPALADATYVEPLVPAVVAQVIAAERPDALLATVGGQTALNLALELTESGALVRHGVELIGVGAESIRLAEDRERFKAAMQGAGLRVAKSRLVRTLAEGEAALAAIGLPAILRASFTLGGAGSGAATTRAEYFALVEAGLRASAAATGGSGGLASVLVEESLHGWKEYELEVIRDAAGNGIVVCSIENIDAMGVHTGDSATVAPAQTLSDREYQQLRDEALAVLAAVGVVCGGSNVQFAVHPDTGESVVIEMNPRVSRSSALASKATGYPIAKIATLLALGYTLPELPNAITGVSSACFEPSLDYTVVKLPRWSFEKFPGSEDRLGTSMQSVGEVMAIGRTFREALQKALRSLELGYEGLARPAGGDAPAGGPAGAAAAAIAPGGESRDRTALAAALARPNPRRLLDLAEALRRGFDPEQLCRATGIDPWFIDQLARLVELEGRLRGFALAALPPELLGEAKREGFSDAELARLGGGADAPAPGGGSSGEATLRARRAALGLMPVFRRVDTCAAEFASRTPYLYSTWEEGPCEAAPSARRKVIVLGSGPNRIGQGIEFDSCCCHAVGALRAAGVEAIMVNCNPETVSTDYDTSDRLYFEPLRLESVLAIVARERPEGVIVSLGGQTPLALARPLAEAGVRILGTPVDAIEAAEDRDRFAALCAELAIPTPAWGTAADPEAAVAVAARIGYPVMLRPSFVLGGRAMQVVYDEAALRHGFAEVALVSPAHPVLLDRFLEHAVEFDLDCIADGETLLLGGIMQHIEEAGVHSGDSCAVFPPQLVTHGQYAAMRAIAARLAHALGVIGPMNVQFAVQDGQVFVLEVNPRASRTLPFLEKATGLALTAAATRAMLGESFATQGLREAPLPERCFVKAPVFPFRRFPASDRLLGPEMKSTGEVMGVGAGFGEAFARAQLGTGQGLPVAGTAFLSVHDRDKPDLLPIARQLAVLGFALLATAGTAEALRARGLACEPVAKVGEGSPHIAERILAGGVQLVINTPLGAASRYDERPIRHAATLMDVPCITTLAGARAAVDGIRALREGLGLPQSLQALHALQATRPRGRAARG
ncbi:carbamoyl-phosphate synthase large subunit [bacterium]|nr:carbamoyl-phosphate synthase large subunit [bacterium]